VKPVWTHYLLPGLMWTNHTAPRRGGHTEADRFLLMINNHSAHILDLIGFIFWFFERTDFLDGGGWEKPVLDPLSTSGSHVDQRLQVCFQ